MQGLRVGWRSRFGSSRRGRQWLLPCCVLLSLFWRLNVNLFATRICRRDVGIRWWGESCSETIIGWWSLVLSWYLQRMLTAHFYRGLSGLLGSGAVNSANWWGPEDGWLCWKLKQGKQKPVHNTIVCGSDPIETTVIDKTATGVFWNNGFLIEQKHTVKTELSLSQTVCNNKNRRTIWEPNIDRG